MKYQVYILHSSTLDRYYVGFTGDELEERLRRHNSAHKGYSSASNDWKIVYKEVFSSKTEAMKREKDIKNRKSRKYIETLIQSIPS